MPGTKSFADESPFLEGDVLTLNEVEPRYELRGLDTPFLGAQLEETYVELETAWKEDEEDEAPAQPEGVIAFDAQTLPMRVAAFVTTAARQTREVEVLLYAHGLDVCGPVLKNRPVTFITERPFHLGKIAEASGRPLVLVVPHLEWRRTPKIGSRLAEPKNLNGVIAEVMERVEGAPSITRLMLAGHSRAYGLFDAMAKLHADPDMTSGALAHLTDVWALDTTYTSPVDWWMKWLAARPELRMTVIYRYGTGLSTGVHGAQFRARAKHSGGRMTIIRVPAAKTSHCGIPGRYLPELLSPPTHNEEEVAYLDEELYAIEEEDSEEEPASDEEEEELLEFEVEEENEDEEEDSEESYDNFEESIYAEASDEEEEELVEEEDETLASSGLTPAELKAVQITSTFETGKRGGFYGLAGHFDGYGISFGLVNWNIGSGSLQPLLRDFATEQPTRWAQVFGPHALAFRMILAGSDADAVKKQLRFAIDEMNTSRVVKGKKHKEWSVKEPWVTYFKRLSEDTAFQAIQVRYVRDLLDRARYFCEYFSLVSEMSFCFMFDAVSSHGKWWLTKKFKDKTEKRRLLLRPKLAALQEKYGKGHIPERDVLLAIADVLAQTSTERWRDNVLRRKQWFVSGEHPRAEELKGLTPRPDVKYSSTAVASSTPAASTPAPKPAPPKPVVIVTKSTMSDADRKKYIAAAIDQAKHGGETAADRAALKAALEKKGTDIDSWFADMVPDATFLGRNIRASGGTAPGVHRNLLVALQRAERALLDQHPGRTAEQLGKDFGIYSISGLRPPKKPTGKKGGVSFHCFGLAIDINHDTNPFVGNDTPKKESPRYEEFLANRSPRVIERAMLLVHGEHFNVERPIAGTPGAIWDVHHRASEALAAYLRLADDPSPLAALVAKAQATGDTRSVQQWKTRILSDRATLPHWDFQHHKHPERTGYMDLPRELVVALCAAGLLWGGQYPTGKDIMHFDLRPLGREV